MDIEVIQLSSKDLGYFMELISVFERVFEWEDFTFPEPSYLQKILDKPSFLVFVAISNQKVVGGLTAYVLDRYDSPKPSAYIYDLAVSSDLQRRGIGKKLISSLNAYGRANGFNEVFVQAETDDLQAINFYRTTPVSIEMQAIHFTYSFEEGAEG